MMIVCGNLQCKYRGSTGGFCQLPYTFLNQFGQCSIWFDKNGLLYRVPRYPIDPEPVKEESLDEDPNLKEEITYEEDKEEDISVEQVKEDNDGNRHSHEDVLHTDTESGSTETV